jgi:hypothetical protein
MTPSKALKSEGRRVPRSAAQLTFREITVTAAQLAAAIARRHRLNVDPPTVLSDCNHGVPALRGSMLHAWQPRSQVALFSSATTGRAYSTTCRRVQRPRQPSVPSSQHQPPQHARRAATHVMYICRVTASRWFQCGVPMSRAGPVAVSQCVCMSVQHSRGGSSQLGSKGV